MLAWVFACPNGLAWLTLFLQVKEVYLGKQSFFIETGRHMIQCWVFVFTNIPANILAGILVNLPLCARTQYEILLRIPIIPVHGAGE